MIHSMILQHLQPQLTSQVFGPALKYLEEQINLSPVNETWEKFGPYSCLLNMDEVNDLDAVWKSGGMDQ